MFSKFELCDHLNSSGQTFKDGQPSQKHPHSDEQIYQGDYWYINSWSSVIRESKRKQYDLRERWGDDVLTILHGDRDEVVTAKKYLDQYLSLKEEYHLAKERYRKEKIEKRNKFAALLTEKLNRFLDEEEIHRRVGCLETETPFLVEDGVVVSDFGPDLVQVSEPQTVSGTSLNVSELDLPPAPLVDPCTAGRTVKDARHDDVARVGSVIILNDSEAPLPHRDPCIAGCIGEDASHSDVDWMGSATTLNDSEVDLPPARLVNHWTVGLICGDLDWGLLRSQAAGMLQSLLTVFCKDMKEQSYFDCKVNSFPFDPGGF